MTSAFSESQYGDELRRQYAVSYEECGCQWSSLLRKVGDRCKDERIDGVTCQGIVY